MKGDLGIKVSMAVYLSARMLLIKEQVPDRLSDEEAATLGAAVITCGQALYQSLGLPLPGAGSYGGYLLVYGGSTATGTVAIQYGVL